jgi:hypothetical protein
MKKLLPGCLLFLWSTISFSQTIEGITLGKSKKEAESVLQKKGFKLDEVIEKVIRVYKGNLMYNDVYENGTLKPAKIIIVHTPKTELVWKLVEYKMAYTWRTAKDLYYEERGKLIGKYGIPDDEESFIAENYEVYGKEMQAFYDEKTDYYCKWTGNNVEISIVSLKLDELIIKIEYLNPETARIFEKENEESN